MRLLLDTNVIIKLTQGRLKKGVDLIEDPGNDLFISVATVWEISIKRAIGKLGAPEDFLQRIEAQGCSLLPIKVEHALKVADLPDVHRDPFDRLLVAQATLEELVLLTTDRALSAYDVAIVQL